ncbi:MAG: protein translocase subunit SecF [Gammaproteobacteria bacterium]|nr:protein translocase subunit SecF [Gammaproteobacteria bacterium]MBP9729348.1 protein translocase subunit SecF [Gammaproteobacteria bacterium]
MEFFKTGTQIRFMGIRRYTGAISVLLWIVSIVLLSTKGIHLGLEFTGGTQVEARFTEVMAPAIVRAALEKQGFHGIRVQQQGSINDILIRVAPQKQEKTHGDASILSGSDIAERAMEQKQIHVLKTVLETLDPSVDIRRTEFVGSEVGDQLMEQGGIAILVSILATMIYITLRFEYRLALSAAIGLCYDAFLILGIFSLFGFEFDLATLASVLAVLSYSLNDTIVVFDRVRENFRKVRKGTPVEIMDLSINQTLSRTIMTSWMTLLVVLALLFFGGETLFGFSMAFFVGIVIGTFSSIYVSGALALWLGLSRADLMPKQRVDSGVP